MSDAGEKGPRMVWCPALGLTRAADLVPSTVPPCGLPFYTPPAASLRMIRTHSIDAPGPVDRRFLNRGRNLLSVAADMTSFSLAILSN